MLNPEKIDLTPEKLVMHIMQNMHMKHSQFEEEKVQYLKWA